MRGEARLDRSARPQEVTIGGEKQRERKAGKAGKGAYWPQLNCFSLCSHSLPHQPPKCYCHYCNQELDIRYATQQRGFCPCWGWAGGEQFIPTAWHLRLRTVSGFASSDHRIPQLHEVLSELPLIPSHCLTRQVKHSTCNSEGTHTFFHIFYCRFSEIVAKCTKHKFTLSLVLTV